MRKFLLLTLLLASCDATGAGTCPEGEPAQGAACSSIAGLCYYFDECTDDRSGVIASCTNGKWSIARNLPLRLCPSTPPANGERCPCGNGRQETPCEYRCGSTAAIARCSATTLTWSLEGITNASCVRSDGGI